MPILCFEGPSAVGKTTAASELADAQGAQVIPEVNAIFERPSSAPPEWYLERQVERYARAAEQSRRHSLVVLDGDPFQPLWYNWAYGFVGSEGLDFLEAFYRPRLEKGGMDFPDLYCVFTADADLLRRRKEADETRQRRGFEMHLQFIEPQRRYFEAMQRLSPASVRFLEAHDVRRSAQTVAAAAPHAQTGKRGVELFDHMVRWLRDTPAD